MSLSQRLQRAWLRRGLLAYLLAPVSVVFCLLVHTRRGLYRAGVFRSQRLPVPLVIVGNLVVGGAGKTPTVLALVQRLRAAGWRPGVISRGHGRRGDGILDVQPDTAAADCGDEPLLLRLRAAVPVVVGRDRWAAGMELLRRHPQVDVIVCDDGLQHLRLARDVQVLVFDERGAGNGWLLPAGPLREPLPPRIPPRSLVLYNAAAPSTALPGTAGRRLLTGATSLADWWDGVPTSGPALRALAGKPLLAVAGIAQPTRFFCMLGDAGLTVDILALPDHHDYATLPWPPDTPDVVLTEKDAVKLRHADTGATRVWVATLDFVTPPEFDRALLDLLPPRPGLP